MTAFAVGQYQVRRGMMSIDDPKEENGQGNGGLEDYEHDLAPGDNGENIKKKKKGKKKREKKPLTIQRKKGGQRKKRNQTSC